MIAFIIDDLFLNKYQKYPKKAVYGRFRNTQHISKKTKWMNLYYDQMPKSVRSVLGSFHSYPE